ncbi:hypothetical protein GCM10022292_16510 [Winogradskyella damuponensis]|uniref:Uncharacterized protein n=1 Tax=Winogradskyella damuponensis TaxID=943939 RepID=A0ABP8CT92_9FLAO
MQELKSKTLKINSTPFVFISYKFKKFSLKSLNNQLFTTKFDKQCATHVKQIEQKKEGNCPLLYGL